MPSTNSSKTKTLWRWTKRLLIIFAIFIFLIVPYGFSWLITHAKSRPGDSKVVLTPAEYNIPFQKIQFPSLDSTQLAGWWLPAKNSPVVIIYCHGLFRSRQEMLERAAHFHQKGYAGFLFDFRRHGESKGELSSIGYLERLDVLGAIQYIRQNLQIKAPIVTWAVSMGTAATMLAAVDTDQMDGLILDSSFLSFEHTITHHAQLYFGLPKFPIVDEIIAFTKWQIGFTKEAFDMRRAIQKIDDCPVLFIAGERDRRMPPEISQELFELSNSTHKKIVVIPQATHGAAHRMHPELYENEINSFLKQYF